MFETNNKMIIIKSADMLQQHQITEKLNKQLNVLSPIP